METKLNPELNTDELENVSGGAPGGIQAGLRDALNELGIKPGGIQAGLRDALNELGIK